MSASPETRDDRLKKLVSKLKEVYGTRLFLKFDDLYRGLVSVILSQNTSDRLAVKACARLLEKYRTPDELLKGDPEDIKRRIEIAGLSNIKTKRLKQAIRAFPEIKEALNLPDEEARRKLLSIPGIGDKTADVLLLFFGGKKAFPVDTHIFRVTARMGFVTQGASYSEVSNYYKERVSSKGELKVLHFNLIRFGRFVCKSRNPLCKKCFVSDVCRSFMSASSSADLVSR